MAFALTANKGTFAGGAGAFHIDAAAGTAGDLMVVGAFNTAGTVSISAISDTVGTTYSKFVFAGGGNTAAIIWGFLGASFSSGGNSMTITWSAGQVDGAAYGEFNGSSVPGSSQDGAGQGVSFSGVTSIATPNITTTGADDLVLNFVWCNGGAPTFGGSWSTANAAGLQGLAYQADKGPGTYSPSATFASSTGESLCVAIMAAASGFELGTRRGPVCMPKGV
jgi:hypothetical protein